MSGYAGRYHFEFELFKFRLKHGHVEFITLSLQKGYQRWQTWKNQNLGGCQFSLTLEKMFKVDLFQFNNKNACSINNFPPPAGNLKVRLKLICCYSQFLKSDTNVPVKSKLQHPPPPVITQHLTPFSCPGEGGNLMSLVFPVVGHVMYQSNWSFNIPCSRS